MRAKEFTTENINPDVYHQDFSHELEIDGIIYRAKTLKNDQQFVVRAYVQKPRGGEQCVGFAKFRLPRHEGLSLSSDWTKVATSYRGKGIASNMYAYARMLGNTINPSSYQLDPGRRMWDKWREKGDAKHLSEMDDDMFAQRTPYIDKDLNKIWAKIEEVVGRIFPDGDPIDYLGPWAKQNGYSWDFLKKACQQHGYNDVYAYWDELANEHGGDINESDDDMFAPTKGIRIADALIRIATSELRELRHNLEVATDPIEKDWTRDQITDIPQLIELANTFRTEPLSAALDAAESLSFVLSIDFLDLLLHYDNIDLRELFTGWEPDDN